MTPISKRPARAGTVAQAMQARVLSRQHLTVSGMPVGRSRTLIAPTARSLRGPSSPRDSACTSSRNISWSSPYRSRHHGG